MFNLFVIYFRCFAGCLIHFLLVISQGGPEEVVSCQWDHTVSVSISGPNSWSSGEVHFAHWLIDLFVVCGYFAQGELLVVSFWVCRGHWWRSLTFLIKPLALQNLRSLYFVSSCNQLNLMLVFICWCSTRFNLQGIKDKLGQVARSLGLSLPACKWRILAFFIGILY